MVSASWLMFFGSIRSTLGTVVFIIFFFDFSAYPCFNLVTTSTESSDLFRTETRSLTLFRFVWSRLIVSLHSLFTANPNPDDIFLVRVLIVVGSRGKVLQSAWGNTSSWLSSVNNFHSFFRLPD